MWGEGRGNERRNHSPWSEFKSQQLSVPRVSGPDLGVGRMITAERTSAAGERDPSTYVKAGRARG